MLVLRAAVVRFYIARLTALLLRGAVALHVSGRRRVAPVVEGARRRTRDASRRRSRAKDMFAVWSPWIAVVVDLT